MAVPLACASQWADQYWHLRRRSDVLNVSIVVFLFGWMNFVTGFAACRKNLVHLPAVREKFDAWTKTPFPLQTEGWVRCVLKDQVA